MASTRGTAKECRAAESPTSESSRYVRKLRDAYVKTRCDGAGGGLGCGSALVPPWLDKWARWTTISAVARRFFVRLLLCGASAALAAACDGGRWGYDYVYPYGTGRAYACSQFTSCGSCTPVEGCGWCAFQGGGACVSQPDFCGVHHEQFSFTWEPSGCAALGGGQEGGATTPDASPAKDASSNPPAPSDAGASPPKDASSTADADH